MPSTNQKKASAPSPEDYLALLVQALEATGVAELPCDCVSCGGECTPCLARRALGSKPATAETRAHAS